MSLSIAVETPLQDDVRAMVRELNAYLIPLSPPEYQFQMTIEQMAGADTTVLVVRSGGKAVGMGALRTHGSEYGEVKRMFARPEARGQGVGAAVLDAVTDLARQRGLPRLKLETGEAPGFEPAWRLYEAHGFTRCGAFGDYPDSGWSRFYEKTLTAERAS